MVIDKGFTTTAISSSGMIPESNALVSDIAE